MDSHPNHCEEKSRGDNFQLRMFTSIVKNALVEPQVLPTFWISSKGHEKYLRNRDEYLDNECRTHISKTTRMEKCNFIERRNGLMRCRYAIRYSSVAWLQCETVTATTVPATTSVISLSLCIPPPSIACARRIRDADTAHQITSTANNHSININ